MIAPKFWLTALAAMTLLTVPSASAEEAPATVKTDPNRPGVQVVQSAYLSCIAGEVYILMGVYSLEEIPGLGKEYRAPVLWNGIERCRKDRLEGFMLAESAYLASLGAEMTLETARKVASYYADLFDKRAAKTTMKPKPQKNDPK